MKTAVELIDCNPYHGYIDRYGEGNFGVYEVKDNRLNENTAMSLLSGDIVVVMFPKEKKVPPVLNVYRGIKVDKPGTVVNVQMDVAIRVKTSRET